MIVIATKRCGGKDGCGRTLPVSEFYLCKNGRLTCACRRCIKQSVSNWKAENPERHAASNRRWRRNNPLASKARSLVHHAHQPGPSDIDFAWVIERLERGVCEFSGVPFVYEPRHPCLPSIDRIDPTQPGHMKANCRVILWGLNGFKGAASEEVFRDSLEKVSAATNQS
jgi:hypothetical protein